MGTQECTQIGENGLSAQPPLACRVRPLVRPTRKVRFSVTSPVQSAPFGHVAIASPAQSAPFGHVAVASPAQSAPFRESDTPRVRLCVRRRLQSGAHVYAAATRFAEASTHTNPRRARFVYTFAHRGSPGPWGRDRPGQGVPASGRSRSGVAPRSLSRPGTRQSGGAPVMSPSCANGAPLPGPPRRRTDPVGRSPVADDTTQVTAPERARRARYADGSAMRSSLARAWPALRR